MRYRLWPLRSKIENMLFSIALPPSHEITEIVISKSTEFKEWKGWFGAKKIHI